MRYRIEQRIHTLAQLAIDGTQPLTFAFTVEEVTFSNWQMNEGEGYWTHPYWLAATEIEAASYLEAWRLFIKQLVRVVPRMALISQCYMEHLAQPIFIKRKDLDIAFVWWVLDREPVGLMFMDQERAALEQLLGHTNVPKEFFYYWRDAVNTFGYSSKLLIMLSAVEALTGVPYTERRGPAFYGKLEQILGSELKSVFWGTRENHTNVLRHRLVHGEYFDPEDNRGMDYVTELHRRILRYFNESIFKKNFLNEDIIDPQRHLLGNADQARSFLRAQGDAKLSLIAVLADADEHDVDNLANYETLRFDDFHGSY
jgi:hypothetical protein